MVKQSATLRGVTQSDGTHESCDTFMMQLSHEVDTRNMMYDEEAVTAYLCNDIARDKALTAYVQARKSTNPCVREINSQMELSMLTDQETCEQAVSADFNGRMTQEAGSDRKLFGFWVVEIFWWYTEHNAYNN